MALTPRQKAGNKAANRVRDQAFRKRYRAYYNARDASKESEEHLAAEARFARANAALEDAQAARRVKVEQLQAQIEELKRQISALNEDPTIAQLNAARLDAGGALNSLRLAQEKAIDAQFPDIALAGHYRCTSAAGWKVPPEVEAEMQAARIEAEKHFESTGDDK